MVIAIAGRPLFGLPLFVPNVSPYNARDKTPHAVSNGVSHTHERIMMVQLNSQHAQPLPAAQVARRILRATGALMLVQFFLRTFGIVENIVMSYYFGTNEQANAYSAAKRIASPIMQFGEQVIMHSFLPPFVQRLREHGERDAWRMASTIINLMIVVMALVVVVGLFFTSQLLSVFVPGWVDENPALVPLTLTLTRVMLVAMIFMAVATVTYCLLNSYKQFALPAASDLVLKASVLLFAVLFAKSWGVYALALGFVIGSAVKLTVQSSGLGRRLAEYRPTIDVRHAGVGKFALLALPLIVGWGFSTLRGLMDTRFLSALSDPAAFSAFDYAKKLCDVPVTFFPYVFGIALFPFLADIAVAGDTVRLREMLMTSTRMMVLIFVPLALAMILLCYPILQGLYGSQHFDAASVAVTAAPLQVFAIGMLIGALEIIVLQFFFALSDTLRPTIIGVAMVPLHITIAFLSTTQLGLGAAGIALALLISKGTKVIVLYTMIRRKLDHLEGRRTLRMLGKVLIALVPFVTLLWLGAHYLPEPQHVTKKLAKLLALLPYVVLGGISLAVYLAVLHLLRVDEITLLVGKIRGKLTRKMAPAAE